MLGHWKTFLVIVWLVSLTVFTGSCVFIIWMKDPGLAIEIGWSSILSLLLATLAVKITG